MDIVSLASNDLINFNVTTSGIYGIICLANKTMYIGSAVNLFRRMKKHY